MVFFNCNACGESLKKNQVEKHYTHQCRRCEVLSCADCGKEFKGDEYKQHIKCMTEDEKYSGKNYKPKPNANKGEQKQELWTQQVQDAITKLNANPKLKSLLEKFTDYPNIPRKKAKFENFLRNSMRVMDARLASQAWDAISVELNSQKCIDKDEHGCQADPSSLDNSKPHLDSVHVETPGIVNGSENKEENKKKKKKQEKVSRKGRHINDAEDACEGRKKKEKDRKSEQDGGTMHDVDENGIVVAENQASNGTKSCKKKKKKHRMKDEKDTEAGQVEEIVQEPKRKKRKTDDSPCEDSVTLGGSTVSADDTEAPPTSTFKWEAAIIGVLKRAPDSQLSIKKLRKKVFGEFYARNGDGKTYTEEKLFAKFNRKVHKNSKFKVHKEHVKLVR